MARRHTPERIIRKLRESEGLILPSRHFESQPLVYLGALRAGTRAVARDGNAVAAAVREKRSGSTYDRDDEIVLALRGVQADASESTSRCRQTFEQRYSHSVWQARRCAEYSDLLTTGSAH